MTLLEEMPVQETVDAIGEPAAAGFGLGAVVVNQVREPLLDDGAARAAAAEPQRVGRPGSRADLGRGRGARRRDDLVSGLLGEAHDHAERVELERASRPTRSPRRACPTLPCPSSPTASRTAASRCSPTS